MEIIGHDPCRHIRRWQLFFAEADILNGIDSFVFQDYPFRVYALVRQIVLHRLRFGNRFVISLPAGHDTIGIGILPKVFRRPVQTKCQYLAGAVFPDLRAENNQIVKSLRIAVVKAPQDKCFTNTQGQQPEHDYTFH